MEEEKGSKKLSKAEMKLAKKLEKEKMLLQIRRDTLARELTLDAATVSKIKEKWCYTLIDSKIPEMQDNLRYILHYMEKLIEAERFRKLQFEAERDELEEKVSLLAKSHSSALDMLFGIYKKRVEDMKSTFDARVSEKKTQAEKEFKKINDHEDEVQENLQGMIFQMQTIRDEKERTMNFNMFFKLDDERSRNTEMEENLRAKLQKKMEKKWGEIKQTLTKYEECTRDRRKEYSQLKVKDDADSRTIYLQMKKTQQMLEQLEELKNCLDDCYAPPETISLINDLREERTLFFNTFKSLKTSVSLEIDEDEIYLKELTNMTYSVVEYLEELVKRAENILTLYRICLKFETQEEKVKTVGDPLEIMKDLAKVVIHIPKDVHKHLKTLHFDAHSDQDPAIETSASKNYGVLNMLWKKVGRVHLSKFALKKCMENLREENVFLKKCLANYMREYIEKKETF